MRTNSTIKFDFHHVGKDDTDIRSIIGFYSMLTFCRYLLISGITFSDQGDIQDDELRMDSEVPGYRYTAYYNVHVDRVDNECSTSAQPPAVVGRKEALVSEGQHGHNLLVLVW